MARWRLTQKHYLNVAGTTWEYRENSVTGRKSTRKIFNVPLYLDPDDPSDCNYNPGGEPRSQFDTDRGYPGELVVAHEGAAAKPKDLIFTGPPTLDMIPLDDEAKAISEEMGVKWGRAFIGDDEAGEAGGYTGRLLQELTETLGAFNAGTKPSSSVDDGRFDKMQEQFMEMMKMNMALIAKLEPAKAEARR